MWKSCSLPSLPGIQSRWLAYCWRSSTALAIGSGMPGDLHSTTTRGMPFTKRTMLGMMQWLPWLPGSSTRNWSMTRKTLFSGVSQSMKRTCRSRPWSQSGRPSTKVPLMMTSVAAWLISRRRPVAGCSRAAMAWAMRGGSSQGAPSRRLILWRASTRSARRRTSRKLARPVTEGWSTLPAVCFQPIETSCSTKGRSTRSRSGLWLMLPSRFSSAPAGPRLRAASWRRPRPPPRGSPSSGRRSGRTRPRPARPRPPAASCPVQARRGAR